MNNKQKFNLAIFFEYACVILIIFISLMLSSKAFASENGAQNLSNQFALVKSKSTGKQVKSDGTQISTSIGDDITGNTLLLKASKAGIDKLPGTARAEQVQTSINDYYFTIHDASSFLLTDIDNDGYYREFNILFDADVEYGAADVYAEMYLSKDGGPWIHYYSSDIFTIYGDSIDDQYEVNSTLVDGYPTGNYDVLIDLYEVGVEGVVATFSSDDTNNLYALPLEDSYHDEEIVVIVETYEHGGPLSQFIILLSVVLVIYRAARIKS
ncbi:choice-of-anchor H family protein [Colwelliaceae bacterium 6471]